MAGTAADATVALPMIDIRLVRNDRDAVATALARKGVERGEVERLADLDIRQREVAGRRDDVRAQVKSLSKEVGAAKRAGDDAAAEKAATESRRLGEEEKALDVEAAEIGAEVRDLLLRLPNLPAADAPDGAGAEDNVVVRIEGHDPESYGVHQRVPHWDIGTELGMLDLERGAKISGSMFPLYRGWGAKLVRALVQYGLDLNADAFEEIRPPTLVRTD